MREGLFEGEALQRLRDALDRLEEREGEKRDRAAAGKQSWGFIPRHLMDKDEVFLELLKFRPLLSIAQAMMGPLVRLRGLSARISYPGREHPHQTPWHQHLRVISNPRPPWFSQPHCIDCLVYLDDLNDDTGAVAVVPESHTWLDRASPRTYEPAAGEVELRVRAGGGRAHPRQPLARALPTLRAKRRMLILSYTPSWLRGLAAQRSAAGGRPDAGLPGGARTSRGGCCWELGGLYVMADPRQPFWLDRALPTLKDHGHRAERPRHADGPPSSSEAGNRVSQARRPLAELVTSDLGQHRVLPPRWLLSTHLPA